MRRHQIVVFTLAVLLVSLSVNCQEHDHGSAPAASADAAGGGAAHRGQTITFNSTPGKGSGYLSVPATKGKHPGIIVIQEWWGVNDWVKEQTDRLASQGYVRVAP